MNRSFWKRFIGSLLIAFLTLSLSRFLFYINLTNYFRGSVSDILSAFGYGLRFDAVTIAYLLGPFFLVLPFLRGGVFERITIWFYLGMLGAMNLLNCIDAEFFKFTARRSTDDLFEFAFISDDLFNIGPNLLTHFWYLLVVFALIMLLALWLTMRLFRSTVPENPTWKNALLLLPIGLLLVLGARGGMQRIPLTIVDASKTQSPELNPVVLSTPFTILKTIGKPELKRFEFPAAEIVPLSPIIKPDSTAFAGRSKGKNVVIIIVESLSTEYIKALNGLEVGYTPFVDSLCNVAMVFDHAYANGHRSIEGIPAVVASIPTLMYEPFTTSRYAGDRINSLANLLKPLGYETVFMHGGNKNSMNFESFAGQAGYDSFYDRDHYPFPDEHYDGFWGISDHYFLNNCVDKLSEYQKPFFASIFTLSSHHPYALPDGYRNRFPKGTLPIHESLGYADESLRQFFEKASKTDWFSNTLFVITADHTSLSEHEQYQTKLGSLRIPIIFYQPSDSTFSGRFHQVVQQADIMPTVLRMLGYEKPFFAFGTDAFDPNADRVAIAFKHDQYQVLRNGQLLCFDGENPTFVYDIQSDPLLKQNLLDDPNVPIAENEAYLKAYLMNYSTALNDNRMTIE
ncbi:MAG: sulfatase-like hydrolase/transferase [Flavobacteriales bacterium]|nr:sulfatase-like hydrolase/transferase [Flavobacteriales bacterium]